MKGNFKFCTVGVSTMEKDALRFIYENDDDFAPIPTFGVIVAQEALGATGAMTGAMPGFSFDLTRVRADEMIHINQSILKFKFHSCCMASNTSRFTKLYLPVENSQHICAWWIF